MTKNNKVLGLVSFTIAVIGIGAAWASFDNPRKPVEFFTGHGHHDGQTINGPEHSGGTDRFGCHNASVPYHCHR